MSQAPLCMDPGGLFYYTERMQLGAKGAADLGFIALFAYLNHTKIRKTLGKNKSY